MGQRAPLHCTRTQLGVAPATRTRGNHQVGLIACNDYILLECCIYSIISKHFSGHPAELRILKLFHEVRRQWTACSGRAALPGTGIRVQRRA